MEVVFVDSSVDVSDPKVISIYLLSKFVAVEIASVRSKIGVPEGHVEDAKLGGSVSLFVWSTKTRQSPHASLATMPSRSRLSAGNTSSSSCSSALSVSSPLLRVERKFWRREKELAKRLIVLSVIGLELNLISSDDSIVAFIIGYKVYRNATKKLKQ